MRKMFFFIFFITFFFVSVYIFNLEREETHNEKLYSLFFFVSSTKKLYSLFFSFYLSKIKRLIYMFYMSFRAAYFIYFCCFEILFRIRTKNQKSTYYVTYFLFIITTVQQRVQRNEEKKLRTQFFVTFETAHASIRLYYTYSFFFFFTHCNIFHILGVLEESITQVMCVSVVVFLSSSVFFEFYIYARKHT